MSGAARTFACLAFATIASCGTGPRYEWGGYESMLRRAWLEPGAMDPADATARLQEQVEATLAAQRLVPPGVRAHLAWMHADAGNRAECERWLRAEAEAYPESRAFVDGMIARLRK